jgi:nicotinamidase-related amidase
MDTALLIIDAQVNMFEPEPVYQATEVLAILRRLIDKARAAGAPVIFVRHNGAAGEPDEPNTSGWEIHREIAPMAGDVIVDKHEDDAFYQTPLAGILAAQGIRHVVIGGMLTECCIDTTVRRAKSLDYAVTLAADAHSTHPEYHPGSLTAEQVIAHHNNVLTGFASVLPAAEITFESGSLPGFELEAITAADRAAIQSGLAEWPVYERWLSSGEGQPFWPYTHPNRVADSLRALWDPAFRPRDHYLDPPRWEAAVARTFWQPLENIPPAFRKANLQMVKGAIDHLLQNPRNPLSAQIKQLEGDLWLYDSRDLRLFYVPHVTTDRDGRERRYVFLIWLAPGVPVHNPFAM